MTFETTRITYGSKAAGLEWLERTAAKGERFLGNDVWRVPGYELYPIVPPDQYPLPKALNHGEGTLFAVRSGSTVSLPGLMETVLNVPGDKINQVAKRVYKSFANKSVQKFLEGMVNPPKGTGVIVQRMVREKDAIFGVVFTCSPNGFPDPYFVYSDSPGDVVGTGKGKKRPAHPNFRWLALQWYEQFGTPPEIEVAFQRTFYDKGRWYLLQIRDQKLTLAEKAALDGKIIKAPSVKPSYTIVGDGWAKITDPGQVAHIEEAEPDVTLEVIRNGARLVIAKEGNPFSHAAVIARTEGVGFGVGDSPDLETPYTFLDGNFYPGEIEPEFESDNRNFELISNHTNWSILKGLLNGGRCDYDLVNDIPGLFVTTLIRYKNYLFGEGPPEYMLEFAQVLSFLGCLASFGEARHENRFGLLGVQKKGGREEIYQRVLLGKFDHPIEWLKFVKDLFRKGVFPGGGYGGHNWEAIARGVINIVELLSQFKEKPNRVTFSKIENAVTQSENMMHNCAVFWDKFGSGRLGLEILNRFACSENWQDFMERLSLIPNSHDFYTKERNMVQEGLELLNGQSLVIPSFEPVDSPPYCMDEYPGYDEVIKEWVLKEEERKSRIQKELEKKGKLAKKVHILYEPAEKDEDESEEEVVEFSDPVPFEFDPPESELEEHETKEVGWEVVEKDTTDITYDNNSIASTDTEEYHDGTKPKRNKKEKTK